MIDLKNLKGFVFYVDMLGFTALTQDKNSALQKTILTSGKSLNIFRL